MNKGEDVKPVQKRSLDLLLGLFQEKAVVARRAGVLFFLEPKIIQ